MRCAWAGARQDLASETRCEARRRSSKSEPPPSVFGSSVGGLVARTPSTVCARVCGVCRSGPVLRKRETRAYMFKGCDSSCDDSVAVRPLGLVSGWRRSTLLGQCAGASATMSTSTGRDATRAASSVAWAESAWAQAAWMSTLLSWMLKARTRARTAKPSALKSEGLDLWGYEVHGIEGA